MYRVMYDTYCGLNFKHLFYVSSTNLDLLMLLVWHLIENV